MFGMRLQNQHRAWGMFTAMGLGIWLPGATALQAQETAEQAPGSKDVVISRVVEATTNADDKGFFIGVSPSPASDTLKQQLGLEAGLVIEMIVPDSPAAQAGLQKGDILVKLGDRTLSSVEDLVRAVAEIKGKETTAVVIRKGKTESIKVTPTERPADLPRDTKVRIDDRVLEMFNKDDLGRGFRWRMVQPGLIAARPHLEFPDELTVQMTKSGKSPAKISVKYKDDSWEFTEDKLQELQKLPEEIRGVVAQFVHRAPVHVQVRALSDAKSSDEKGDGSHEARSWSFVLPEGAHADPKKWKEAMEQYRKQMEDVLKKLPAEHSHQLRKQFEQALEHHQEELKKRGAEAGAKGNLEVLRDEIRDLRSVVDELRKKIDEKK